MADYAKQADEKYARTIRAAARMMEEWSWEDAFDAPVVIDLRDATEAEQTPTSKEQG